MELNTLKTYFHLKDIFENNDIQKISVPSYQRAYSWEQKQLDQFIGDLIEMTSNDKKGYYFGHFIFEENDNSYFVIDGQQRITTFILFLIACKRKTNTNKYKNFIDKFSTVDYDNSLFSLIKNNDTIENEEAQKTLSISRIEFALEYFEKQFNTKKLVINYIEKYIEVLLDSHISTHITKDKAVAVQIFELHNSRGIKLNTIEKVKAKLMKAVYLNTEMDSCDEIINRIQKCFGEIYHLEEKTSTNSFRGNLTLDEILLIHLRMVDSGEKLSAVDFNVFKSPSKQGNREDNILNYLDTKCVELSGNVLVEYIENLISKFKVSVEFITLELIELDNNDALVGDTLILERGISLSFFLLLKHKNFLDILENKFLRLWEKLLFTRDFHDKYYRLQYTDHFEDLFYQVANESKINEVITIVEKFVLKGFRPDKMIQENLQIVVLEYLSNEKNKNQILKNAFNWNRNKMTYLLYKFEVDKHKSNRKDIREIMKNGVSIEHILPQEWPWDFIEGIDSLSEETKKFEKEITNIINGIGNLLILSPSENSSQSNSHPKEKVYSINSYSYRLHKENRNNWQNHLIWNELILNRGIEIYQYLLDFVKNDN